MICYLGEYTGVQICLWFFEIIFYMLQVSRSMHLFLALDHALYCESMRMSIFNILFSLSFSSRAPQYPSWFLPLQCHPIRVAVQRPTQSLHRIRSMTNQYHLWTCQTNKWWHMPSLLGHHPAPLRRSTRETSRWSLILPTLMPRPSTLAAPVIKRFTTVTRPFSVRAAVTSGSIASALVWQRTLITC